MNQISLLFLIILVCFSCEQPEKEKQPEKKWVSLFDGESLEGWIPKIVGQEVGKDTLSTFRIVNGAIQVNYDQYEDKFKNRFGHLFYEKPFSNYHLKLRYRFIDKQIADGEGWAFMNSGLMYHAQSPFSMDVNQGFPISLEGQFLGAKPNDTRPTGNLCTPGMHVVMGDTLTTKHCVTSSAKSYPTDKWINAEFIVYNDSLCIHIIENDTVIQFSKPIIGGEFLPESDSTLIGKKIKEGYFALQSESHPIEFKDIMIREF